MYKKIFYFMDKKLKLRTFGIFLMVFFGSFMELIGVAIVLPIINLAMGQDEMESNTFAMIVSKIFHISERNTLLIALVILTVAIYVFKTLYMVWITKRQYRFAMDVRCSLGVRLMRSYLNRSYEYFLNTNSAEMLRSVSQDVDQFYEVITFTLMLITSGITALAIVGYLFVTNALMALMLGGLIGLCGLVIVLVFNKKFKHYGKLNQKYIGTLNKHRMQAFSGVKEIKIAKSEDYFVGAYEDTFIDYCKNNTLFRVYSTLPKYLVETVSICGIMVFLGINILFVENYQSVIASLAVFAVGAIRLLPLVNGMSTYYSNVMYFKPSVDLLYNDVKASEEYERTHKTGASCKSAGPMAFEDALRAEHISFKYEKADKEVLNDVSLEVKKGQSVAFVGPSGGGKTTMADVLLGLLDPSAGAVTLDGVNIKENLNGFGSLLGYIPQVIYLTDDSIRNNVAFGIHPEDIDEEQVWKALEEAQLKEFVESLPEGLDTEVGEQGARLSGGQRQRIGIARALYRNPSILVFDEATSALDNETEKEVMKAIDGLQGTKTMIMIAHRLTTIENCDVVYRVENGSVVKERG